jgi:pimeloyl-ACP methyl ester carboxylesterase
METLNVSGNDLNIDVDGYSICYDDFGTGEIPIIFIHGFPFDKTSWKPQMDFFKKIHRVIAYDLRGFGKSIPNKAPKSISSFAYDLIRFMDAMQIKKAIVCGLSLGGYILLNAVNLYPERFKGIILSSTQCIADSANRKENRNIAIEQIKLNGLADFALNTINSVFGTKTLNTRKKFVESIRNLILSTSPQAIIETLGALAQREETCTSLNKIFVPTLILCSKEDVIINKDQAIYLYINIINSRLQYIYNAGHMLNLEQPDEFNQNVLDFVSDILNWNESIYLELTNATESGSIN